MAAAVSRTGDWRGLWLQRRDYFWRNPMANARFQTVTDFDGWSRPPRCHATAIGGVSVGSRRTDGRLAYPGRFGAVPQPDPRECPELVNPSIRTLGFSPDGSLVTFWIRKPGGRAAATSAFGRCLHWAASRGHTLKAWPSSTGRTTVPGSHTTRPGPGDPLFVSDGSRRSRIGPSSLRLPGSTVTFRCGRPTESFIYFVRGFTPGQTGHLAYPAQPAEPLSGSRRTWAG